MFNHRMHTQGSENQIQLREVVREIDQAAMRLQGILTILNKKSIKNQAMMNRILLSQVQLNRIAETLSKRWIREELK